jgi:hypothetical protein
MITTKTLYVGGCPISSKCVYSICDKDNEVINKEFYVNLYEVDTNEFINVISKNKFANKMPVKNEIISRFVTYITFKKKDINQIIAHYATFLEKNINISSVAKLYNDNILTILNNINNELIDYRDDLDIYVDIYDSIVNSSYIGIFSKNSDIPLFTAASLAETFSREDYQLNFGTKVTGIISASFVTRPISIGNIYFEPVAGSYFTINNNNIKISYIGTEFTKDKFEDLSNLRILMDLEFEPICKKMYKNKVEFERFNSFVKFIKSGSDFDTSTKFGIKLTKISIKCEGTKSEEFGNSNGVMKKVIDLIKQYYPDIQFNDIYDSTDYTTVANLQNNNEFILKVIMDSAAK